MCICAEPVGIRYSCDYCYKDISSIVRIQCAECGLRRPESPAVPPPHGSMALEEVDLCVECFAAGVEFGHHLKTHPYRILKPLDFAIYHEDWRADEELLLLEAVEANGVGNWNDAADQLGSRTPEECREHYLSVYLGAAITTGSSEARSRRGTGEAMVPLPKEAILESRKRFKEGAGRCTAGGGLLKRPRYQGSEEALATAPVQQSVPANHEIAGYMPLRGEFETEVENDAEAIIKDMAFADDDTPSDRQLKFAILDIYSSVLERRAARHTFISSHGLVEFKRHQAVDKARSREEREIYLALKPFARFLAVEDFQRLLDGLVREEELRRQIGNLQELRRNGIRAFDEVALYEAERKHLELYLKGGTSSNFGTSSGTAAAALTKSAPSGLHAPIKEPFPLPTPLARRPSVTSAASSARSGGDPSPHGASPNPSSLPPATAGTSSSSHAATIISIPRESLHHPATATPATTTTTTAAAATVAVAATIPPHVSTSPVMLQGAANGGRKASTPLNISHAEGVELLSEKERHLCSILRLYPRLYLSIKDTLIREYLKYGGLKRAQARAAVKIDVNKTSKLYDFFVAAGWIRPPASGE